MRGVPWRLACACRRTATCTTARAQRTTGRSAARSGLVLGVVAHAVLQGVELRVQEGARQTVLETGRRTVHAYAVGTLRAWDEDISPRRPRSLIRFTYNPHRGPTFTRVHNGPTPVYGAAYVWFDVDGAWTRPA